MRRFFENVTLLIGFFSCTGELFGWLGCVWAVRVNGTPECLDEDLAAASSE